MPKKELDWTEATETLDRIKCPHCNDCLPSSTITSCPDEGEEVSIICPHCQKPFVCSWTAGPRYYHTLIPLPAKEPDQMVCDGHECPYCMRPLHQGLTCTSCQREFCPECHLEIVNDECPDCSFEGIVDTLMHCKTIEDFAKHMQRLMLIERESNCDGVAMDNALNTLQAIAKRGQKK